MNINRHACYLYVWPTIGYCSWCLYAHHDSAHANNLLYSYSIFCDCCCNSTTTNFGSISPLAGFWITWILSLFPLHFSRTTMIYHFGIRSKRNTWILCWQIWISFSFELRNNSSFTEVKLFPSNQLKVIGWTIHNCFPGGFEIEVRNGKNSATLFISDRQFACKS